MFTSTKSSTKPISHLITRHRLFQTNQEIKKFDNLSTKQVAKSCRSQSTTSYYERRVNKENLNPELKFKNEDPLDQILKYQKFEKLYDNHQPLNLIQKSLLAVGSSIGALVDPHRDDLVAISSETFIGHNALKNLHQKMRVDSEASRILSDKPRINTIEIDFDKLRQLPVNTLGYQYSKFLDDNNITCDSRKPVKYVDNTELAYVLQRYREVHDFTHLLFEMRTTILGEVVIKWIEAIQTEIPMCIGAALFGPMKLYPKQRENFMKYYIDWAIENGRRAKPTFLVYYEERWEQDLDDLRKEMRILPPPKID